MKICEVEKDDRKSVAEYFVAYWKSRDMTQYPMKWALKYLKNGHKSEITDDKFFVAKDGKKIVGTIALIRFAGDVAEIRDDVWHDNSVGSTLLFHLINYAKKKKIRKIYSLALKNKVNFYGRHGFKKEGVLKDHFKKGENLAIMSKFLK